MSIMYPCIPAHTSLQIGEYMNILHCTQCHYQAGLCQNIPPSQNISSIKSSSIFLQQNKPAALRDVWECYLLGSLVLAHAVLEVDEP